MKKILILALMAFAFAACSSDDKQTTKEELHDELYNKLVTPEMEIGLKNLGVRIYKGINPPRIEGFYTSGVFCIESTLPGDVYKGTRFLDTRFHLSNQNDLTISVETMQIDQSNNTFQSRSNSEGTFISGSGDNFSIFHESETKPVDGHNTISLQVYSGTVVRDANGAITGIRDFKIALLMKDNNGWEDKMPNGAGRVFVDPENKTPAITEKEYNNYVMPKKSAVDSSFKGLFLDQLM